MSIDKQIEEIDCKKCLHYESCQIAFRNSKSLSIYEEDYDEEQYFADTIDCDYYVDKNIYRKASEIALKVIDDIESATNNHIKAISALDPQNDYCTGGKKALDMTLKVLAELKKKYDETEKGDG